MKLIKEKHRFIFRLKGDDEVYSTPWELDFLKVEKECKKISLLLADNFTYRLEFSFGFIESNLDEDIGEEYRAIRDKAIVLNDQLMDEIIEKQKKSFMTRLIARCLY